MSSDHEVQVVPLVLIAIDARWVPVAVDMAFAAPAAIARGVLSAKQAKPMDNGWVSVDVEGELVAVSRAPLALGSGEVLQTIIAVRPENVGRQPYLHEVRDVRGGARA